MDENELLSRIEALEREVERQGETISKMPKPEELAILITDNIKLPIREYIDNQVLRYVRPVSIESKSKIIKPF